MARPSQGNAERAAAALLVGSVIDVDEQGQVWRIARYGRPCAPHRAEYRSPDGYARIPVTVPGIGYRPLLAHRLVYEVRVGPIPEGHSVFPLDGNWLNTAPANLATRPGRGREGKAAARRRRNA